MKNKRIDHITKNVWVFLPKSFFQIQEKVETCKNLNLIILEGHFFGMI